MEMKCPKCNNDMKEYIIFFKCRNCNFKYEKKFQFGEIIEKEKKNSLSCTNS